MQCDHTKDALVKEVTSNEVREHDDESDGDQQAKYRPPPHCELLLLLDQVFEEEEKGEFDAEDSADKQHGRPILELLGSDQSSHDIGGRLHQASLHVLLQVDERYVGIGKASTGDERDDSNVEEDVVPQHLPKPMLAGDHTASCCNKSKPKQ